VSAFGIITFWIGAIALVLMVLQPTFLPKHRWVFYTLMFIGLSGILLGTGVIFMRF